MTVNEHRYGKTSAGTGGLWYKRLIITVLQSEWTSKYRGRPALVEARRRLLERLRNEVNAPDVIDAMERVPREAFVPEASAHLAYEDIPLPIGEGQTVSQPYVVAVMVNALELRRTDRVLEIGTGSGYQAAVLAEIAAEVITVERFKSLADHAAQRLEALGYSNVQVHMSGPELGWPSANDFDAVIVAAGAPRLPSELIEQLKVGGRLVVPVGSMESQELMKVSKTRDGFAVCTFGSCRFVPLIGKGAWPDQPQDPGRSRSK